MEWASWGISNITEEFIQNEKLQKQYKEKYKKFKRFRSEIIEAALEIENILTTVLLHFFVGQDYSRHKLLRSFIFDAEFCTFMQKRKMLSQMFEMFPKSFDFFSPEESKKLRQHINNIVLERNIFAHGNMFIDARDGSITIEYYQGGAKREKIEEKRIRDTLKQCISSQKMLFKLNEFLRNNRLELAD
jgi:hypothetical protein